MISKTGECKICKQYRPINSKGYCADCQYVKVYGKTKQQAYFERKLARKKESDNNISYQDKTVSKTLKRRNNRKKYGKDEPFGEQFTLDELIYEKVFKAKPNRCEECGVELSDVFRNEDGRIVDRFRFSHILSKGAFPEYRHCEWNFRLYCLQCHQKWEFGDRKSMKSYTTSKHMVFIHTSKDLVR